MRRYTALLSGSLAVGLMAAQFATIRLAPSSGAVRVVLPATVALAPLALWPHRRFFGVWVLFVGLGANLAPIVANGGLMPIERATVAAAIGDERASRYAPGEWIDGSKDVLVGDGQGRLTALGDSITVRAGGGGFVASPGDIVVWVGLLAIAAEASVAWQRKARRPDAGAPGADKQGAPTAEGGAVTSR